MATRPFPADRSGVLDATRLPVTAGTPRFRPSLIVVRVAASTCVVIAAFLAAAWVGRTFPFESRLADPFGEAAVVRAMPFDTPMPYDISLAAAGRGDDLPYHTQWTSALRPDEVAAQFHEHLVGSPRWLLTQPAPATSEFTTTLARTGPDGYMTHFARISVEGGAGQTIVTFDFTPIPSSLAPE